VAIPPSSSTLQQGEKPIPYHHPHQAGQAGRHSVTGTGREKLHQQPISLCVSLQRRESGTGIIILARPISSCQTLPKPFYQGILAGHPPLTYATGKPAKRYGKRESEEPGSSA